MNKILIFLLIIAGCLSEAIAQDIHFDWAKQLDRRTGLSFEESYFIGTDSLQNVFLAGNFRNTMDLDPGTAESNVSSEWDNVFICKLDPTGNFIWGKQLGGNRFTLCKSLFVDPAGNVYTTGSYSGVADFDPGIGVFNLTADPNQFPEDYNVFICKLNTNGDFQWVKGFGSLGEDSGNSISVDNKGNVYTTGSFTGIVNFNPSGNADIQGANGIIDAFVTKLNANGDYQYTKVFSSNHSSYGACIHTDNKGNVYTTGYYDGTIDLDPGTGQFTFTTDFYTSNNIFLAKLDSSGNFLWAVNKVNGDNFAVDANENVYIYLGTLYKYDKNGKLLWKKPTGGQAYSAFKHADIRLDLAGNVYLTGMFRYTADFDPGPKEYNITVLDGGYNSDVFVSRLDPDGNFVWAKAFGGYFEDYATSLWVDHSGNVYTTGVYGLQADFDPSPEVYNMDAFSGGGIFIHKMSPCTNKTTATLHITECNSYTLNNITYDSSGMYTQVIPNKAGCDSTITLYLSITGSKTTITVDTCGIYSWNRRLLNSSGIYNDTLVSKSGCDSIVQLHLTIRSKSLTSEEVSICEGQNYAGYTISGTYLDTFAAVKGCDSIRTLYLTIQPGRYSTITTFLCEGQSISGHSTSGTYVDTLIAANGYDSVRRLYLVVRSRSYSDINATICAGQSYYGHTATGDYEDTLIAANGCYSICRLHLLVTTPAVMTQNKVICKGENYDGHTITGTYTDTLHTVLGCDSIVTTHHTVLDKPSFSLGNDVTICSGDSLKLVPGNFATYVWQDGSIKQQYVVRKSGLYRITVSDVCGTGYDEIMVYENNCTIYFPSAFTPNNDGINEHFTILNPYGIRDYHLVIYNRFGQRLFKTRDYGFGWNGKYQGQLSDQGTYVWFCEFKESGKQRSMKGSVLLLH